MTLDNVLMMRNHTEENLDSDVLIKVTKRNGKQVEFDKERIVIAIEKAMKYGSGIYKANIARIIADEVEELGRTIRSLSIYQIEDMVYYKLIQHNQEATAKAYEAYKSVQAYKRENNTTDGSILSLLGRDNDLVMTENSNKNAKLNSTQRDLIAGEVSKDIVRRKIIPSHLVHAHDNASIHIHDMDYLMQPMHNCCLIKVGDMLDNGTVINGKMIESPKSFQVACTILTQIIAQVASNQYGGQSVDIKHLGKYVAISYEKHLERSKRFVSDETKAKALAMDLLKKEIKDGVQTIQYQINTLLTTNGQSPFVTVFMNVEEGMDYEEEIAMVVEEILKQRIEGVKNELGVWITPAFPKLIYVLNESNVKKDSKYYHITELSAKCTAKRMYPDYISSKKMKEIYDGNVFSPMGCRSMLPAWYDENGIGQFEGRLNLGVQTLNLPQVGLLSEKNMDAFWNILDERLELIKEMGLIRFNLLKDVPSDVSPIHWQDGAIARLKKGEKIGPLFLDGYATVSIGYIGLHELVYYMLGKSISSAEGSEFAKEVLKYLKDKGELWKSETRLSFTLYGTPSESTAGRLCEIDNERFGDIEGVTDKGYYTNSYHVTPSEEIDAFTKLSIEAPFQNLSTGGCISYIEIPNMNNNIEAILDIMDYMYENISYAEFNTKSDYCHICGFDGEIIINDDLAWECPQCHNKNKEKMNVVRRTCGYLGENFWSKGRTKDIKDRVLHI